MKLQYEITGIVSSQLRRALQSVEGQTVASAQRTERKVAAVRDRSARSGGSRSFTAENRRRVRAIANEGRARRREDQQAHRRRMALIAREELAEIAAARKAGAAKSRARASMARGALRGGYGAARGVMGYGGGILGLGTGFAAIGAIRNEMGVVASASTLANKAFGIPGETRSREQIRAGISEQAKALGIESGFGAESVLGGLSEYQGIAGRLNVGQQLMPFLTKIADATGADIGDVGRTAGQIVQSMGTRNMSESGMVEGTKSIMADLAGQAKVGSIEFKDLAQNMGKVMSATNNFEGNIADMASTMGAISQLAIAGAASTPEEAMTAILRFRDAFIKDVGKFDAAGVQTLTFDSKGNRTGLRDPMSVVRDVLTQTGGDLPKLGKLFGIRAMKAFGAFQGSFTAAGGGKMGIDAMMKVFDRIKGAGMSFDQIDESSAFRREDPDKQFAIAVEKFNRSFGERLLPVITQAIPKFEGLIPVLGNLASGGAKAASWLMENPFQGVGVIIGAGVAKELAASGLNSMMTGSLGPAMMNVSKAAGGAALAVGALAAGIYAIDWVIAAREKEQREKAISEAEGGALQSKATGILRGGGTLSSEQRASLSEQMSGNVAKLSELRSSAVYGTTMGVGGFSGARTSSSMTPLQRAKAGNVEDEQARLTTLLLSDAMNQVIEKVTGASAAMSFLADETNMAGSNMKDTDWSNARTTELLYR